VGQGEAAGTSAERLKNSGVDHVRSCVLETLQRMQSFLLKGTGNPVESNTRCTILGEVHR
jgi:hypothetical protein